MALDKSKLQTELENWLNNKNNYLTRNDAYTAFADAYETYALDAQDVSGDVVNIYNKPDLISTLEEIPEIGTVEIASQKFEDAINAFWTGALFYKTIAPAGTILPETIAITFFPTTSDLIKDGLTTIFEDLSPETTLIQKAQQIATILDTGTKTILTYCVGTNPSPPPDTLQVFGLIT